MTHPADDPAIPGLLTREVLAATAAHELNNIVASLKGFVELATESTGTETPLRRILGEVGIGVERIVSLADDMQMLAAVPAEHAAVPLRECVATSTEAKDGRGSVMWECDPATVVVASPLRIRRAVAGLVHHAAAGSKDVQIRCHVPLVDTGAACVCGRRMSEGAIWLSVRPVEGVRVPQEKRADRIHVSGEEFRALALTHLAHCAGAHLAPGPDPDAFSVVLLHV